LVPNEVHFLDALKESLESGQTPADELLARYHSDWNGDVSKVFGDYSY
jgi:glutamate--cysteine ligase